MTLFTSHIWSAQAKELHIQIVFFLSPRLILFSD